MGIFDRFRKNKNEETVNQGKPESTKKETSPTERPKAEPVRATDSISQFYNDCVADFHQTAKENGMATKGLIFIPELIPIGERTVLAFLNDSFFQMQFGHDPHLYYYAIMSLSLQAGMVFAVKWHENYSALKTGYVDQIIEEGPATACKPYLRQLGITSSDKENEFYQKIYHRWLVKHEPYWKLSDPRQYTFRATVAAYQLGISMILEKHGY